MTEALILTVSGTVIGVAWSTFGIYLGSLVIKDNPPAAYAIRGFFLAVVALIHGFLRSHTPRLFIFVLLMLIVAVVSLTSTAKGVTPVSATQILYPILIAAGCITLINLCIFPEFSSRFLGQMTIDTLNDTARALENAGRFFVEEESSNSQAKEPADRSPEKGSESDSTSRVEGSGEREVPLQDVSVYRRFITSIRFHAIFPHNMQRHGNESLAKSTPPQPSMKELTDSKAQIRKKLADCKAAQQECNFELAVSVLPPRDLKPLSVTAMKKLVANTIAVISACESKFALIGGNDEIETTTESEDKPELARTGEDSHPDSSARLLQPSGHFGTTKMIDEDPKERNSSAMLDQDKAELHMIKPKREIEFGDARLLRYLLRRVAKPYETLHQVAARAVEVVIACVAHAYVSHHDFLYDFS